MKELPPVGDRFFSVGCDDVEAGADELGVGVGPGLLPLLQPAIVATTTAAQPAGTAHLRAKRAEQPIAVPLVRG